MTVSVAPDGTLELKNACPAEDAEVLLRHLLDHPRARIRWDECEAAHTAVIQVLLVAKAVPSGRPKNPFLARFVEPILKRAAV
jgi:hypothetical protein